MPLQAAKLPISHNNVVGENTVLQLNILETGVLTLVVFFDDPSDFLTTRQITSGCFKPYSEK